MSASGALAKTQTATASVQVGLIGHGIGASRTPLMHTQEGAAQGLDYRYELVDTAELPDTIDVLLDHVEAQGFRGVNVTYPFKQSALPFLDDMSEAALAVGAVNTVVFENGRRTGHNTDFWGFSQAFKESLANSEHSDVLLLGAGGAGGAVAHALLENGVETLWIYDINQDSAQELASKIGTDRARIAASAEQALGFVQGRCERQPHGHGLSPRNALRPDRVERRPLGRRHCLFSAGNSAFGRGSRARLPNDVRCGHGRLSGGARVRAIHRHHTKSNTDEGNL